MKPSSASFPVENKRQSLPVAQDRHPGLRHAQGLGEEPHDGRQAVQGLAVQREDDIAVPEPHLPDDAGWFDLIDLETLDGPLAESRVSVARRRARGTQ